MQWKTWLVSIDGHNHKIEVEWWPPFGSGDVYADDQLVYSWPPGLRGMPGKSEFEVYGKPFLLRKKGFVFVEPELYIDGKLIPADK